MQELNNGTVSVDRPVTLSSKYTHFPQPQYSDSKNLKNLNDIDADCPSTNKSDRIPAVNIGVSVYNGAKYLKEALDSLQAQTFADFDYCKASNSGKA